MLALFFIRSLAILSATSYSSCPKRSLSFDEISDIVSHLAIDTDPEDLRACLKRLMIDGQPLDLDVELIGMARDLNRRVVEIHRKRLKEAQKMKDQAMKRLNNDEQDTYSAIQEDCAKPVKKNSTGRQFKFALKGTSRQKRTEANEQESAVETPSRTLPVRKASPRISPRSMAEQLQTRRTRMTSSTGSGGSETLSSSSSTELASNPSSGNHSPKTLRHTRNESARSGPPSTRSSPRTPDSPLSGPKSHSPSSSSLSLEDQITKIGSEVNTKTADKPGTGRRKSHGDKKNSPRKAIDSATRKRSSSDNFEHKASSGPSLLKRSNEKGKTHITDILPTSVRSQPKNSSSDEDEGVDMDGPKDSILLRALRDATFQHVRVLLEHDATIEPSCIHKLCSSDVHQKVKKLKLLMNFGGVPYVNSQDINGLTPLHHLLQRINRDLDVSMEMLQVLVDNGADADITDYYLRTAMYYFLEYVYHVSPRGNEILRLLLICCNPFQTFMGGYEIVHMCWKDSLMFNSGRYARAKELCLKAKAEYPPYGVRLAPFPTYHLEAEGKGLKAQ